MKYILPLFLLFSVAANGQFRVDFGIEAQVNQNKIRKWEIGDVYAPQSRTLSAIDVSGDTIDVFFNQFSMENNFEIPLYFRFNWNRHFVDLKMSNSYNTVKMEGVSNFNPSWYEQNYGTYNDFVMQAAADGFPDADSADYRAYMNAARKDWESDISFTEQFQLLSLTANYGFRFLPHKSIKPWFSTGFSIKGKYRKYNYDYLSFSNDYVQDLTHINKSINKFADISLYWNLNAGFELYRFRVSAFFQTGFFFTVPIREEQNNPAIPYVSDFVEYDELFSFGLGVSADLFRHEFGLKVHKDNVTGDDLEVSKIRRTKDRWDFGIRFSRRGFNELSTYYGDSTQFLSVMKIDTVMAEYQGELQEAKDVEVAEFGDVKRIWWSGVFDIYSSFYFGKKKRGVMNLNLGFSRLLFDVHTTELRGVVVEDSSGQSQYLQSSSLPRLRHGAYRKAFNIWQLKTNFGYKVMDRDIFDLRLTAGFGISMMAHVFQGLTQMPQGVNELKLYDDVENAYFGGIEEDVLVHTDGPLNAKLDQSPNGVISKFNAGNSLFDYAWNRQLREYYPTFKLGIEANLDRFSLGLAAESSLGEMDRFMLRNYSTIYFSIGYKIWSR